MKHKICISVIIFAMAIFCVPLDSHALITIDGYLHSDWGVTPSTYGPSSDWIPFSGIIYKEEDQINNFLDPGYGGQQFDAEALYWTRGGGNIYLALVTGTRPAGWTGGSPGDIYFNFGAGRGYGLKTTGGNAGHLYKNPLWNGSGNWGGSTNPTTIKNGSGTDLGAMSFMYVGSYTTGAHYVMEMAIPENKFGNDWLYGGTVHWTQTCGNDAIDLNIPETPEPATVALLGIGLVGLAGRRIRGKRSQVTSHRS